MATKLTVPISEEQIRALKVGDQVLLSGVVFTARDAAHKYMIENFVKGECPQAEKDTYKTWRDARTTRDAVLYVGARDGQVHAFDAGSFRWGNNPSTSPPYLSPGITENRGYFAWSTPGDAATVDYGTGQELWSFIPANLMARLKNNLLQGDDRAMVDA